MYLIIKDPTARTVRVEEISFSQWARLEYNPKVSQEENVEKAIETAKSIAIKENLCFTPSPSY